MRRNTAASAPAFGFTLVELMIVVAIIGVLAAVAIPSYLAYINRARVSEGFTLAQPLRTAVSEYYATHGNLPAVTNWLGVMDELGVDANASDGAASGAHVIRIWWHNNASKPAIHIKYARGALEDKLIYLRAEFGEGSIRWRCTTPPPSANGVPDRYLPASCR